MGWRTIVITGNAKLDYRLDYLVVRKTEGTARIHISEIEMLIIESTSVSITTMLLSELIKKQLYRVLSAEIEDNGQGCLAEQLRSQMVALLDELVITSDYRLTFDSDVSVPDYLSMFKVALQEPEGLFSERLAEYMGVVNHLLGTRVFIVVNCNCYIDEKGFEILDEVVKRQGYSLTFIDHQVVDRLPEQIETHIIDVDHCDIDDQTCRAELQCSNGIYSEIII